MNVQKVTSVFVLRIHQLLSDIVNMLLNMYICNPDGTFACLCSCCPTRTYHLHVTHSQSFVRL